MSDAGLRPMRSPLPVTLAERKQDDLAPILEGEVAAGRRPGHAGLALLSF